MSPIKNELESILRASLVASGKIKPFSGKVSVDEINAHKLQNNLYDCTYKYHYYNKYD